MSQKDFLFNQITVFFKHTDNHGFVHPYYYLEWMSYAREFFFQQLVPNFRDVCNQNIKMVTYKVEMAYFGDVTFGSRVLIHIYSKNIKKLSFDIVFDFYDECQKKIGRGLQTLTFLDSEKSKAVLIPEELKKVVLAYEHVDDN